MWFFRLMAITVMLLTCVVLGAACTGATGERGADGVGIAYILPNDNGSISVILTNGNDYTLENLIGQRGEKGDTGAQGLQGVQGVQGIQGIQGEPGPNMIVAMGTISDNGTILNQYNVSSCTWNAASMRYEIVITGISYDHLEYVTLVTPMPSPVHADYNSYSGMLIIGIRDSNGTKIPGAFSFMVLDTTP